MCNVPVIRIIHNIKIADLALHFGPYHCLLGLVDADQKASMRIPGCGGHSSPEEHASWPYKAGNRQSYLLTSSYAKCDAEN